MGNVGGCFRVKMGWTMGTGVRHWDPADRKHEKAVRRRYLEKVMIAVLYKTMHAH